MRAIRATRSTSMSDSSMRESPVGQSLGEALSEAKRGRRDRHGGEGGIGQHRGERAVGGRAELAGGGEPDEYGEADAAGKRLRARRGASSSSEGGRADSRGRRAEGKKNQRPPVPRPEARDARHREHPDQEPEV